MDRLVKIAVPPAAETVFVPDSVPVEGLLPMLTVTAAVELIKLFDASSIRTVMAGAMTPFSGAFVGCCAKARCQAGGRKTLRTDSVMDSEVLYWPPR